MTDFRRSSTGRAGSPAKRMPLHSKVGFPRPAAFCGAEAGDVKTILV